MLSKKDMLTLGVLAIGGVAVASSFAGGDGGGVLQPIKARVGGIVGSQKDYGVAPTIYNLPAAAPVTFPKAPSFDISTFLEPTVPVSRGAAGVSSVGKKAAVRPYLYTGGEVKAGAVSVAPWAMGRTTPSEIGVTTALKYATTKKTSIPVKKEPVTTTTRTSVSRSYGRTTGGGVR